MSAKLALAPWVAFGSANAICCSLVVAAAQVSWQLGFSLAVAYCMASLGLAVNLESQRWQHGLRSWLWILVCCQVGCVGTWLSTNAIAPWNFSMEVRVPEDSLDTQGLGHIVQGQHLYFSQTNESGRILMRASRGSIDYVAPGVMDAHSFIEHNGNIFFIGRVLEGGECLWGMRGGGDAVILQQFQPCFQLRHLRRNESLGAFLFQAVGLCGWFRSITEFRSNGTVEGTEATEGDFPGLADLCLKLASGMEWRPPTGRLLSVLLLGILPQTGLATYLLIWKKVPGVFLNVFVGAYAATFILWILMKGTAVNLLLFLQASTMTYATTACVAVALNQVLWSNVCSDESFVEEGSHAAGSADSDGNLGTWASSVSCISFFGAVHLVLNIPSSEGWAWPLYGILTLPQIAFALLMRRTTPMAEWVEMGGEKEPLGMSELGCADGCGRRGCTGVGAREWVEMGGEKEPLGMSKLGCADGCRRRGCCGRRVCMGMGAREWVKIGGEKELLGMSELGCADSCGRRGCKEVGGNGWGEGAAGDESLDLRTAADGVGAREPVEMNGEKEPLEMSELGRADGCRRSGCEGGGGDE
eukprot:s3212_g6.t3